MLVHFRCFDSTLGYPGEGPTTRQRRAIEQRLQDLIPDLDPHIDMSNRLRHRWQRWRSRVQDPWSTRLARRGLTVPLYTDAIPSQDYRTIRNQTFTPEVGRAISATIKDYANKCAIRAIDDHPADDSFYSSLLAAPKKDGGLPRMCMNLRPLNRAVPYRHFKQEGLHTVRKLLQPHDWMVKVDLKDAYHHLWVNRHQRRLFRFRFDDQNYECCSMPFGLASAPRIFTKLIRSVVRVLRAQGVRLVFFIDDFLLMAQDLETLERHTRLFIDLFQDLGWILHPTKSCLLPVQSIEFLGLTWNSNTMSTGLPKVKVQSLQRTARRMSQPNAKVRVRDLARFLGQIQFAHNAIQLSRIHSCYLLHLLRSSLQAHQDYQHLLWFSDACLAELRWWSRNLRHRPERWILDAPRPNFVHGRWDASRDGWGGYATFEGRKYAAHGVFPWHERHLNNNVREALAQVYGWQAVLPRILPHCQWSQTLIRTGSDNMTWVRYFRKEGGRFLHLNLALQRMFRWLNRHDLRLEAYHVPGVENRLADHLSRLHRPQFHLNIDTKWLRQHLFPRTGIPDLDLFASRLHHVVPQYVSKHYDPHAQATNAFSLNWQDLPLHVWCFPPPTLVPRVTQRLTVFQGTLLLLVPWWPSQPWFPLLWEWLIDDPILLPDLPGLWNQPVRWPMIVLSLSGNVCARADYQSRLANTSFEAWAAPLLNMTAPGNSSRISAAELKLVWSTLTRPM